MLLGLGAASRSECLCPASLSSYETKSNRHENEAVTWLQVPWNKGYSQFIFVVYQFLGYGGRITYIGKLMQYTYITYLLRDGLMT